jgi:hypothetical protein
MDLVVAQAVSRAVGNPGASSVIADVFDVFEQWAQETYEGHRIAAAFGIEAFRLVRTVPRHSRSTSI